MIDYMKEKNALEQSDEWFKPKPGQYKIVFLSEPEPDQYVDPSDGSVTEQIKCSIEYTYSGNSYQPIRNNEYTNSDNNDKNKRKRVYWNITKGTTFRSLYGQLMLLGAKNGHLMGVPFSLLVNSDGQKNSYTVLEAIGLVENN